MLSSDGHGVGQSRLLKKVEADLSFQYSHSPKSTFLHGITCFTAFMTTHFTILLLRYVFPLF